MPKKRSAMPPPARPRPAGRRSPDYRRLTRVPFNDERVAAQTLASLGKHVAPHLQSFNFFLSGGQQGGGRHSSVAGGGRDRQGRCGARDYRLWVDSASVTFPMKKDGGTDTRLLHAECRRPNLLRIRAHCCDWLLCGGEAPACDEAACTMDFL